MTNLMTNIHIQYIYNTYTIHIQDIYNTFTIHIHIVNACEMTNLMTNVLFLLLQLRLRCRSNNSPGLFSSRDHQDHVLWYDDELLLNFLSLSSYNHRCNHNGFNLYGLGTHLFRFHLLWRHNQHKHQSHRGSSCTLGHYSYHSVFSTMWWYPDNWDTYRGILGHCIWIPQNQSR